MGIRDRTKRLRPLRRTTGTRLELVTVAVFLEGTETEPEYIDGLKREYRDTASIEFSMLRKGGQPFELVESARKSIAEADREVDAYWCVFDVESPQKHPKLKAAVEGAPGELRLAISNPCFELWLILHFQDQTAALTTKAAEKLRGKLDGTNGKHLDADKYMARRSQAIRRAQALRKKHAGDGTLFPEDNPSSTFDAFLEHLDRLVAERGPTDDV